MIHTMDAYKEPASDQYLSSLFQYRYDWYECDKYRNYYYRKKSIERKIDKIEDVLFDKKTSLILW